MEDRAEGKPVLEYYEANGHLVPNHVTIVVKIVVTELLKVSEK